VAGTPPGCARPQSPSEPGLRQRSGCSAGWHRAPSRGRSIAGSSPRPRRRSPGPALSCVVCASGRVAHTILHPARAQIAQLRVLLSPPLWVRNEITQPPPGGRLRMQLAARQARISSCSAAAVVTTRRQPPHSAAMFAESQRRSGSLGPRPARAPGSRGDKGGVGEFGCQPPGFLHHPRSSAARHWPPRAAPAPAAAASGSRCALRRGPGQPSLTPPQPRLARLLPLRSFPFFALAASFSSLLSSKPRPKQANKSIKAGRALIGW
jgi:hypothetical protein